MYEKIGCLHNNITYRFDGKGGFYLSSLRIEGACDIFSNGSSINPLGLGAQETVEFANK